MAEENALKSEPESGLRHGEARPWYRKFTMRLSLEGKLILCFMAVLCTALAVTCIAFVNETHQRLADIMGEQARQVATALSLSSGRLAAAGEWEALDRSAQELIKGRNILFVGYLDSHGRAKALASRDVDFALANLMLKPLTLTQVSHRQLTAAGDCLEVTAPIFSNPTAREGQKVMGYVTVGVSQAREETQLDRVQYLVIGIACVMIILAMPVAYLLIHRVFLPIRVLVAATRRITQGDLDSQTEIDRPDVIGELARSFDEMTKWVRKQQQDLAAVNARLAEANHDLELRIDQRTAQLESANKRLSSEITEKDEFLRAVSHDLNAPLRNIAGMVTMLLTKHTDDFDQEVVHRMERIKANVEIETDLIGELLELSRIKTRRHTMEPIDLAALIEELRGLFDSDLKNKAIALIVDTPMPRLNAERLRVRQIFQNLIDNAIKYMGEEADAREIHIGCHARSGETEFYVADNGIGIDTDDLDKVFLVFRRGRNTATQNVSGKGVGLASVKSIVETYEGAIWASSERGLGATFRFTISGKYVMAEAQEPGPKRPELTGKAAA